MDIQYITTLNLHLRQQGILGSPTLISFGEFRSPQFYLLFHYASTYVICEENSRVWSPPPENVYIFYAKLMTAFLEFSGASTRVTSK
jgi:hypothetical protein